MRFEEAYGDRLSGRQRAQQYHGRNLPGEWFELPGQRSPKIDDYVLPGIDFGEVTRSYWHSTSVAGCTSKAAMLSSSGTRLIGMLNIY